MGAWVSKRPWPSIGVSSVILIALAIPVLDLQLGQNDVGALSKSTTARQAYDGLSRGFSAGENGPMLISVDLTKPAQNDQASLNKLESQQQQQEAQVQQQQQAQVEQLVEEGVPQDEAEQEVQADTPPPTAQQQKQQKEASKQEAFLKTTASDPRLQKLRNKIAKTADVDEVSEPKVNGDGRAAVLTVISTSAPSSDRTETLVRTPRDDVLPAATKGQQMTAYVGGQTAAYIDLADQISDKLPQMILIVVGLSLHRPALRLPVDPDSDQGRRLQPAVGRRRLRGGHARLPGGVRRQPDRARARGPDRVLRPAADVRDPVRAVNGLRGLPRQPDAGPLQAGRDPTKAVIDGLATTGRVITSAALIMVCVFSSFILNGDPLVKEFGVGLAVAIAIDATLVRCLLVPAVMVLMGDRAWWLPNWLDRLLPNFSIEGEEYFADAGRRQAGARQARRGLVQAPLGDLRLRLLGLLAAPRSPARA